MPENDLTGSASLAQIARYYGVSTTTMNRRLKPYKSFFAFTERKRIYYERELQFIKRIFGDKVKKHLEAPDKPTE